MPLSDNNPWGIRFMAMIHMANDSGLFHATPAPGRLPLYEAKMIHQFDHRWATYLPSPSGVSGGPGAANAFRLGGAGADGTSRELTEAEKADPAFAVTPRYWVEAAEVEARLKDKGWERGWLMGWRDITNATNERTVIASVVPRVGVGHTMPLFMTSQKPARAAALLANLDSLTLDFIARVKVGGTHLTYGYLKQFPILPPDRYSDADLAFIVPRVLELTYSARDLAPWAADLGHSGEPFPWDPERRAQLRAELDAWYARLYGLSRDELRYILDPADVMGDDYPSETFRVLKHNEIREFGEYRTRRLVLAAWDELESGLIGSR